MRNINSQKQVIYTPKIESGASEAEMRLFNRAIAKTNGLCSDVMTMRLTVDDDVINFPTKENEVVYFMFKEQWGNFFMDEIIVIRAYFIRSIIYTPKLSNCKFRISHLWHQKPNGTIVTKPSYPSMDLIGDLLLNRICILTVEPTLNPKMTFLNIKKQIPDFER